MQKYRRHFLVCITNRPPDAHPSCGARGSGDVLVRMQKELDRRKLREFEGLCVTGTTCLGGCEDGPNIVVYPENVWYGGVEPDDVAELVDRHAAKGEVVERLRNKDVQ